MRITILLILLLLTPITFGQESQAEIPESKIYTQATYFDKKNEFIRLQVRTHLQDTIIENREFLKFKTENFSDHSEGLKNKFQTNERFDILIGDQVQLLYRSEWYNDSTGITEYEDKHLINIEYIGDSIIQEKKSIKLLINGYNYLSGTKDKPKEFLMRVLDGGYYYGNQFIPFKDYKPELNIIEQNGQNVFFRQEVSKDTINGFIYEKIVQTTPNPYRYLILPLFPLPFVDFGNVYGTITYSKIKGIEKGTKRKILQRSDKL